MLARRGQSSLAVSAARAVRSVADDSPATGAPPCMATLARDGCAAGSRSAGWCLIRPPRDLPGSTLGREAAGSSRTAAISALMGTHALLTLGRRDPQSG